MNEENYSVRWQESHGDAPGHDANALEALQKRNDGLLEQHRRDSATLAGYAEQKNYWKGEATMLCKRVQRQNDTIFELLTIAKKLVSLLPSNEGLGGRAPVGAFAILGHEAQKVIAKTEVPS